MKRNFKLLFAYPSFGFLLALGAFAIALEFFGNALFEKVNKAGDNLGDWLNRKP